MLETTRDEAFEERLAELEAFKAEWTPFLVSLSQTLHAMGSNPMFAGVIESFLPPQHKTLLATIDPGR
jgi:hypothetical protein